MSARLKPFHGTLPLGTIKQGEPVKQSDGWTMQWWRDAEGSLYEQATDPNGKTRWFKSEGGTR